MFRDTLRAKLSVIYNSSTERALLQSCSQLAPTALTLAHNLAPNARRSGVARSKGVLGHRAFAPRPEHHFRTTDRSREAGGVDPCKWSQKARRHGPERSQPVTLSKSICCERANQLYLQRIRAPGVGAEVSSFFQVCQLKQTAFVIARLTPLTPR
jgi:hypothetical protein